MTTIEEVKLANTDIKKLMTEGKSLEFFDK